MKEAILAMQHLIDWIDKHAIENPGLIEMSKQIGYSPYYCSEQFHRVAGITIKDYHLIEWSLFRNTNIWEFIKHLKRQMVLFGQIMIAICCVVPYLV